MSRHGFRRYCTHCGMTANWYPSPGGMWDGGIWEHLPDHTDMCLPISVDVEVRELDDDGNPKPAVMAALLAILCLGLYMGLTGCSQVKHQLQSKQPAKSALQMAKHPQQVKQGSGTCLPAGSSTTAGCAGHETFPPSGTISTSHGGTTRTQDIIDFNGTQMYANTIDSYGNEVDECDPSKDHGPTLRAAPINTKPKVWDCIAYVNSTGKGDPHHGVWVVDHSSEAVAEHKEAARQALVAAVTTRPLTDVELAEFLHRGPDIFQADGEASVVVYNNQCSSAGDCWDVSPSANYSESAGALFIRDLQIQSEIRHLWVTKPTVLPIRPLVHVGADVTGTADVNNFVNSFSFTCPDGYKAVDVKKLIHDRMSYKDAINAEAQMECQPYGTAVKPAEPAKK